MSKFKVLRMRIKLGRRLMLKGGICYVDAMGSINMSQRLGMTLLGGISRLNKKACNKTFYMTDDFQTINFYSTEDREQFSRQRASAINEIMRKQAEILADDKPKGFQNENN
jgi:hypothetical protein